MRKESNIIDRLCYLIYPSGNLELHGGIMQHILILPQDPLAEQSRIAHLVRPMFDDFEPGLSTEEISARLFGNPDNEVDVILSNNCIAAFGVSRRMKCDGKRTTYSIGAKVEEQFQNH
jgi:hypothetical protein